MTESKTGYKYLRCKYQISTAPQISALDSHGKHDMHKKLQNNV
jgi:hypothetical protein